MMSHVLVVNESQGFFVCFVLYNFTHAHKKIKLTVLQNFS